MTTMLQILQRELAAKHDVSAGECYPIVRLSDRALIGWYLRDRGFIQGERFSA